MEVFITGVTGFVGSHLAELCLRKGDTVHGLRRPRSREEHLVTGVIYHDGDIRDASAMFGLLSSVKPAYLWHLASQSFVPQSNIAPIDTLETNALGTVNVLEAVRHASPETRMVTVGSSEEYGLVFTEEVPITEDNPLRPMSMYGVSKVSTDLSGFVYNRLHGLQIIRARSFNSTGPRRGEQFVCSRFAKAVAEIEAEKREPVFTTGNLDAVRDFTDVRDIVTGYYLMAEKGHPGDVYNMCSGVGRTIQSVLDMLLEMAKVDIKTEIDPKLVRQNEVPNLIGSCEKIKRLGWEPIIPFDKTLGDLLNYWRERV